MSSRPRPFVALLSILSVVVLVGVAVGVTRLPAASAPPAGEGRGGPVAAPSDNPELAEQQETTDQRNEAFTAAKAAGKTGQVRPANAKPSAGWAGEVPYDTTWDDWEPAIAADPHAPYVYALATRYGAPKPCSGNCPSPWIALKVSADNGVTWTESRPLCACKGSGQFDPIIEVVPNTGDVYSLFMIGFNVWFTKSVDHGVHWTDPVQTYGNVAWNDKPIIAMTDDGQNVYAAFNGPTGGDPWIAQSHDSGATWTQTKLVDSTRYYFDFDSDVAADGTVYFAQTAILYGGGGNKGTTPTGQIEEHVFISRDRGATWENRTIASVFPGPACVAEGCTPDYYLGHIALSADGNGSLVALYDGAAAAGGPQTIQSRRSTDGGRTWSAPTTLSTVGENSVTPAVESRASGDVRAWYYQTSGGGNADAWNVWYRSSTDGGSTWAAPVKISDATGGAAYKTAAGFGEVYGDYGELAITSAGKSIAIWGEGASYNGPGGVWINRQL